MAWVARTTRDNNKVGYAPGNTPAHVGPGTYAAPSAFGKKRNASFAPFASTADRGGGVTTEVTAHYTPGPGSYTVAGANPKRSPHHAANTPFLSLSERFKAAPNSGVPGPGSYKSETGFKRRRGKKAAAAEAAPAVTWVRVPTAPSIPAHGQSYGYEEGRYGELTMQKAPGGGHTGRGKDTVGPGSYDPNDRVLAGRKRQTVDFGRSRSKRTDFAASEVPGPGEYTAGVGKRWVREAEKKSSNFASRVARSGPAATQPKSSKPTPGPGTYGARTAFQKKPVPERQQFFGSTARRFKHQRSKSAGPGPGSYDIHGKRVRGRGVKQPPSTAHVGFASTSARFGFDKPSSETPTPGAGSYEVPTLADNIKRKPTARNGVFGSTSKRFYEPVSAQAPGPGAYEAVQKPSRRTKDLKGKSLSVFASKQGRFGPKAKASEAPPPGSYDVTPTWRTRSFARRRDGQGLMASGPKRFQAGGILSQDKMDAPGPGAYAGAGQGRVAHKLTNRKKVMVSNAPRFRGGVAGQPADNTPGPGAYDTEYVYGSLHKRTFNMTIAEQEAGW